jgi:hydrogenase maturation protein HypF
LRARARAVEDPGQVTTRARRAVEVHGIVQGVGFRPYVYALASRLGLSGFVQNRTGTVWIEIEGETLALDRFIDELGRRAPPASRLERVATFPLDIVGARKFTIEPSERSDGLASIGPDLAMCGACRAEMSDPEDRRFGHAFITCTDCGPRMTIVTSAPYDRARTTMARFDMCSECRHEYKDVSGRRFHAQPIACPNCGPRLSVSIEEAARAITGGRIVAIKGIGGYHLACDATNEDAVRTLRARKQRDDKPFAIMARDLGECAGYCDVSEAERELLTSASAPIVLLERASSPPPPDRAGQLRAGVATAIAPGTRLLGVMLPYTPLHTLLMRALDGPIVLTSGNVSDEPIAFDDDDARARLHTIADVFVTHDREIVTRADDSVVRVIAGVPTLLRRARGYAPAPIDLPLPLANLPLPLTNLPLTRNAGGDRGQGDSRAHLTLAVGAHDKNVFAIGVRDQAYLSPHIGDLTHERAARAFRETIDRFERALGTTPTRIACDLHPDYESTIYAEERAAREGLPLIRVQHHRAHFAGCLADAQHDGPAIGVCFDGAGFGDDGTIWGGEIFVGDAAHAERAAHLWQVRMPGGDAASREGWRMALSYALSADVEPPRRDATIESMITNGIRAPLTSSAGRLFDAVASFLGVRDRASYDGQAACELEAIARASDDTGVYPFELHRDRSPWRIDLRPMFTHLCEHPPHDAARRFHRTLATAIAETCALLAQQHDLHHVALSGGVFQNEILTTDVVHALIARDLIPLRHRRVPPNDGGICYGQLAVASRMR